VNEVISLIICNNAASPAKVCPDIITGEGIKTFYEGHTSLTHSFQTNSKVQFLSLVLYFYYACMSIKYYYSFYKIIKFFNVFVILCDFYFFGVHVCVSMLITRFVQCFFYSMVLKFVFESFILS
jgi:hypothetical protein